MLYIGSVRDGNDWYKQRYFQSTTSELDAVVAMAPAEVNCPWSHVLIPLTNQSAWQVADEFIIEEESEEVMAAESVPSDMISAVELKQHICSDVIHTCICMCI